MSETKDQAAPKKRATKKAPAKKTTDKKPLLQTCERCVFFRRVGASNKGTCHRYPPQPGNHQQATTLEAGWCGEFQGS